MSLPALPGHVPCSVRELLTLNGLSCFLPSLAHARSRRSACPVLRPPPRVSDVAGLASTPVALSSPQSLRRPTPRGVRRSDPWPSGATTASPPPRRSEAYPTLGAGVRRLPRPRSRLGLESVGPRSLVDARRGSRAPPSHPAALPAPPLLRPGRAEAGRPEVRCTRLRDGVGPAASRRPPLADRGPSRPSPVSPREPSSRRPFSRRPPRVQIGPRTPSQHRCSPLLRPFCLLTSNRPRRCRSLDIDRKTFPVVKTTVSVLKLKTETMNLRHTGGRSMKRTRLDQVNILFLWRVYRHKVSATLVET